MKFVEFINEAYADYKKEISEEQAIELIKKNCKNIDLKKPLYRGIKKSGKFLALHGEERTRKSIDTSNHYTLIIDEQLKKINAPLRSKSLMCATRSATALMYGTTYAIFPYDGIQMGRCVSDDIWDAVVVLGNKHGRLRSFNEYLNRFSKEPETFKQIVSDLSKVLEQDEGDITDYEEKNLYQAFKKEYQDLKIMPFSKADKKDVVEKVLAVAYDPIKVLKFQFGKIDELDLSGMHEVWFSGKCVAIELDTYKKMLKDGKFE